MSSIIFGGFGQFVYTSSADSGDATPRGIMTRLNPILDTSNINVRGTGRRGLYDILLGMRQPQFTMDILPTDMAWIALCQSGQLEIPYLHYRYKSAPDKGLTFTDCYFNRTSVEARHNEAIAATVEVWADSMDTLNTSMNYTPTHGVTPYRWLDSRLSIGGDLEPQWWSWRYEVNNNLQRLGRADSGGTRAIKARHRDVNGLIVKDLESFDEWWKLMILDPTDPDYMDKFRIEIEYLGDTGVGTGIWVELFDQAACRWGRIEAPVGPEDLQAKRFPFTAIDYT